MNQFIPFHPGYFHRFVDPFGKNAASKIRCSIVAVCVNATKVRKVQPLERY